jgi:hypothetical protein
MRNRFAGPCYRCGKTVEAGQGFFERPDPKRRVKFNLHPSVKWLTQHKECSVRFYGTDVFHKPRRAANEQ